MLGLLATDVRYIWQEIGLEMTASTAMMTKLQLSESTLGTISYCTHCLYLSQMFSCHSLYIHCKNKKLIIGYLSCTIAIRMQFMTIHDYGMYIEVFFLLMTLYEVVAIGN